MDPQQLPLEPLISPPAVSWWPLAPVWWILITALILLIIGIILYRFYKKPPRKPAILTAAIDPQRTMALAELASYEKPYQQPAGAWLQQINILLKRLCILRYPDENTKTLIGHSWLNYLDSKCKQAQLKKFSLLVEAEYHPNYSMDKETIEALYSSIELWITHHV